MRLLPAFSSKFLSCDSLWLWAAVSGSSTPGTIISISEKCPLNSLRRGSAPPQGTAQAFLKFWDNAFRYRLENGFDRSAFQAQEPFFCSFISIGRLYITG